MNNPQLYSEINGIAIYTVKKYLDEYSEKFTWKKNGDTIIDLGCGDGSVTCVLQEYLPENYEKFIACDINENMIKFAREQHGGKNIIFVLQDVEGVFPDDLIGSFNHVFSFNLFHWVRKQEKAFQNVYDLLTEGGQCFLEFFSYISIYHVFDILGRGSKWGDTWLKGVFDNFISPYYGMKDPDARVKQILHNTGFVDIDVQCKKMSYNIGNVVVLKNAVKAVEPYNMPMDVFDNFFTDFLTVGKEIGFVHKDINSIDDTDKEIIFNYETIIVYARKP